MADKEKVRVNFWVQKEIKENWQKTADRLGRTLTQCILEAMHEWSMKFNALSNEDLEKEEIKAELAQAKQKNEEIMQQVTELISVMKDKNSSPKPVHPELKDTILASLELNTASFDNLLRITKVDESILMDALEDLQNQKLIKSMNKEGSLFWGNANA